MLLVLASCASGPASADRSFGCIDATIGPRDATRFVDQAIEVLRACGRDPARFRLELREKDPFAVTGSGRTAVIQAVFRPLDPERDYPVSVSAADPCVVAWLDEHGGWTGRQREIFAVIRERAALESEAWLDEDLPMIRITETAEWIGAGIWKNGTETRQDPAWRIVLSREGLTPVVPAP